MDRVCDLTRSRRCLPEELLQTSLSYSSMRWFNRSLSQVNPENTIALRAMSLVIAIISSAMFGLFNFVVIETATKPPRP